VVAEVDLSAVRAGANSRLDNSAALHRRAVKPQKQRPLTQYQPRLQLTTDTDLFEVCSSSSSCSGSGSGSGSAAATITGVVVMVVVVVVVVVTVAAAAAAALHYITLQ